jgi:hypothetical protein
VGLPLVCVIAALAVALQPWVFAAHAGPVAPAASAGSVASVAARAAFIAILLALGVALRFALRPRRAPPSGWLVVDDEGIHRIERGRDATLATFGEPIGLTVLASVDRAMLRLALTTPRAARYLAVRVRDNDDATSAHLLIERALTAADEDVRAPTERALSAADADKLVTEVLRRAPGALDRVFLSDAGGEGIVLERGEIRVGPRRIDLAQPLDWRASLFQELGAYAVSVCQATWIRQGDFEVVFVASMPGDGARAREADSAVRAAGEEAVVRRTLARDVRLMQAAAGEPPPRELRRAIDRSFMLALRQALDRAPRAPRASTPTVRTGPRPRAREKLG